MTAATAARGDMPLGAHLKEARGRTLRAAVALVLATVAGFAFSDQILDILRVPIEQIAASRDASLNYDSVTGAFDLKVRVAVVAGIVMASPVWLFQLFRFLSPGLTPRERRYTFGYTLTAIVLFIAGCALGFTVFPHMVELLTSFADTDDSTILTASTYVDFVLKTVVATGIAFVLPLLIVLLNAVGVLSAATITRSWRFVVVGITVFSALVTPAADIMSMFLIAIPMSALFAGAVGIAHLHDRRIARRIGTSPGLAQKNG
ncbi:twin-arginine translocase subunit TatC [Microbacterium sp. NPDC077663]|uniref:twin-arginine translocase subunit TatC n=1 Tax=Microbacterium sp. NPDC077663 TaxID=3364189 RepID=UPI0037C549F3